MFKCGISKCGTLGTIVCEIQNEMETIDGGYNVLLCSNSHITTMLNKYNWRGKRKKRKKKKRKKRTKEPFSNWIRFPTFNLLKHGTTHCFIHQSFKCLNVDIKSHCVLIEETSNMYSLKDEFWKQVTKPPSTNSIKTTHPCKLFQGIYFSCGEESNLHNMVNYKNKNNYTSRWTIIIQIKDQMSHTW